MAADKTLVKPKAGFEPGYVTDNTDCNDVDASVHASFNFYADGNGDGYGNNSSTTQACSAPAGYVSDNTDCNDTKASIHPNATEVCNGLDDNCDGQIDEGIPTVTYYRDADGDGYGNAAVSKVIFEAVFFIWKPVKLVYYLANRSFFGFKQSEILYRC